LANKTNWGLANKTIEDFNGQNVLIRSDYIDLTNQFAVQSLLYTSWFRSRRQVNQNADQS